MKKLTIEPKDGTSYVDQFWSGMYATLLSLAQSEQRLIWNRYSAFLVIEGLIANSMKDLLKTSPDASIAPFILLATTCVGILVSCAWHFLNYCGWLNQNIFFQYAAQLEFSKADVNFPTEEFPIVSIMKPNGHVYLIAQLLPISFYIFYSAVTYWVIRNATNYSDNAVLAIVLLTLIGLAAFLIPQRLISHRDLT